MTSDLLPSTLWLISSRNSSTNAVTNKVAVSELDEHASKRIQKFQGRLQDNQKVFLLTLMMNVCAFLTAFFCFKCLRKLKDDRRTFHLKCITIQ